MTDKKITQLNNITGANLVDADEFVVVDISADETKAITLGELKEAFDAGSGFVRVTGDTMTGALDVQSTITADGLTVDGATTITGNISPASDEVLLNLASLNGIGNAGNMLRFTDTDPTAINNGSIGKIQFYSEDTDAVVVEIEGQNADASPDGRLLFKTAEGTTLRSRMQIANNGDISFYEATGTTPKFFWDASAESLGIGTSSIQSNTSIHIVGADGASGASANVAANELFIDNDGSTGMTLGSANDGVGYYAFADPDVAIRGGLFYDHSTDDMGFRVASQTRMTLDNFGNVGIGTDSPLTELHVKKTSSDADVQIESTSSGGDARLNLYANSAGVSQIRFGDEAISNVGSLTYAHSDNSMAFRVNSAEQMRIDSSGNVGVGTSSPDTILHTYGTSATVYNPASVGGQDTSATLKIQNSSTAANTFSSIDFNTNNNRVVNRIVSGHASSTSSGFLGFVTEGAGVPAERMRIDSSGSILINTASHTPTDTELVVSSEYNATGTTDAGITISARQSGNWYNSGIFAKGNALAFTTGDTGLNGAVPSSEAMRIDASGNLLVGTTSDNVANQTGTAQGVRIAGANNIQVASTAVAAYFNKLSTDGDIVEFRKNGSTVGSIGNYAGTRLRIGSNAGAGLIFGGSQVYPATDGAVVDNTHDLGTSSYRWKDLHLSGGVVFGDAGGSGTSTSNSLDSYEEGTWTPVAADAVSGGNESSQTAHGYYVKVGSMVYVHFNISNINTTGLTSGNNLYFTGLPFAAKSVTGNAKYTGTAHMSLVTFSGSPMLNVNENQTAVSILEVISGSGADNVKVSQINSGASDVHGNLCYQTA